MNEPERYVREALLEVLAVRPGFNGPLIQAVKESSQKFVRNSSHLALFTESYSGHVISAWEAVHAYGPEVVAQLADKRAVGVIRRGGDIPRSIRVRRERLGLDENQLALADTRFTAADVKAVEENQTSSSIFVLTRIAETLALRDYQLGAVADGGGDHDLAYRLRDLSSHQGRGGLTPSVTLALVEAAWVISTQTRLASWLRAATGTNTFTNNLQEPTPLGSIESLAYREGYALAHRARQFLKIGPDEPVHNLDYLIEDRMNIPVIQIRSNSSIAGATISNNGDRGIVVNITNTKNSVFTRRMTIAHELCHLLFDENDDLKNLRVDMGEIFEQDSHSVADRIEARANAFAVEFLAPQRAVARIYASSTDKKAAMDELMDRFGVGFSAMSWQLKNSTSLGLDRNFTLPSSSRGPSDSWKAEVGRTTDFFVFRDTPAARTGRFAKYVSDCVQLKLITNDSAAEYFKIQDDSEDRKSLDEKLMRLQSLV